MKYKDVFKNITYILVLCTFIACAEKEYSLIILHTNDTHSQIEPATSGSYKGLGGYARRMAVIDSIRNKEENVILMDAGDFSQGTPVFNFYHGHVEIEALNQMKYDVVCIGNHEFDNGVDTLAAIFREADFPIVCANYQVTGSALEGLVLPYTVLRKNGLRIGVFGLGVNPQGLIADKNFAPLVYLDPIECAQWASKELRYNQHCDIVVCLSHLGTEYADPAIPSDRMVAQACPDVDVIVGGHTHKVVTDVYIHRPQKNDLLLSQVGKMGGYLGKITVKIRK